MLSALKMSNKTRQFHKCSLMCKNIAPRMISGLKNVRFHLNCAVLRLKRCKKRCKLRGANPQSQ